MRPNHIELIPIIRDTTNNNGKYVHMEVDNTMSTQI